MLDDPGLPAVMAHSPADSSCSNANSEIKWGKKKKIHSLIAESEKLLSGKINALVIV